MMSLTSFQQHRVIIEDEEDPIHVELNNNERVPGEGEPNPNQGLSRSTPPGRIFGGYQSFLWGWIVIGPHWVKLSWSLLLFIFLGILLYLKSSLLCQTLKSWTLPLETFLLLITFISFLQLVTTDPGVLPLNYNMSHYILEAQHYRHLPHPRLGYCQPCDSLRPPRSFHCTLCDICIREQDLHFYMGGNCVGALNIRKYIIFVNLLCLYTIFTICLDLIIIFEHAEVKSFSRTSYLSTIASFIITLTLSILPQTGLIMFIYRIYLIKKNRTMREEFSDLVNKNRANTNADTFMVNLCKIMSSSPYPSFFCQRNNKVTDEAGVVSRSIGRSYQVVQEESNGPQDKGLVISSPSRKKDVQELDFVTLERLKEWKSPRTVEDKTKPYDSSSMLENGGLQRLGERTGRFKRSKKRKGRGNEVVIQEIARYKEISGFPQSSSALLYHARVKSDSLSDSNIPRTENDALIIQMSRALKFERIILFLLRGDRAGLIEYSHQIDIGSLIGVLHLNPNDLQLVELGNGVPQFGLPRGFIRDVEREDQGLIGPGVSQLAAAGLVERVQVLRERVRREREEEEEARRALGGGGGGRGYLLREDIVNLNRRGRRGRGRGGGGRNREHGPILE